MCFSLFPEQRVGGLHRISPRSATYHFRLPAAPAAVALAPFAAAACRIWLDNASAIALTQHLLSRLQLARSRPPPIAARCRSWSPIDRSVRPGEPSFVMRPRIVTGFERTGCPAHFVSPPVPIIGETTSRVRLV